MIIRFLKNKGRLLIYAAAIFNSLNLWGQIDTKSIAKAYQTGVVKVLLYDPILVKEFRLKAEQGFISRGSGFFVTPEGAIFTNGHVIDFCVHGYLILDWEDENGVIHHTDFIPYTPGLEKDAAIRRIYYSGHAEPVVQVFKENSKEYTLYKSQVLSIGKGFDGAMIKLTEDLDGGALPPHSFKHLPLGNSDAVQLGEDFAVLGFPSQYMSGSFKDELKDTITVTVGRHSGWDYVFDDIHGLIKTDAAIHEGNSGGPVFGESGSVIGIATAMGAKTHIGLIGSINNMYWIIKPYPDILGQLSPPFNPKFPPNGNQIEALSGMRQPVPTFKPGDRRLIKSSSITIKGRISATNTSIPGAHIEIWRYQEQIGDYLIKEKTICNEEGLFNLSCEVDPKSLHLLNVEAEGYLRYLTPLKIKNGIIEELVIELKPIN